MDPISEDIRYANDVINTISIRSTRLNRVHHQKIYEKLANRLCIELATQLSDISGDLSGEPSIVRDYRQFNLIHRDLYGEEPSEEKRDYHMYLAILNYINSSLARMLIDERFRNRLYVYRVDGEELRYNPAIESLEPTKSVVPFMYEISEDPNVESIRYILPTRLVTSTNLSCVARGILLTDISPITVWHDGPREVVMKISNERSLVNELKMYDRLMINSEEPAELPGILSGFEFLGNPVLIMEPLEPLTINSRNLIVIFRSLLGQLREIHRVGIHCDIKPDNVMQSGSRYYLIDLGGMVSEGSRRNTYTPSFASQRSTSKVTSKRHDLFELIFTMNYLSKKSRGKSLDDFRWDLEPIWRRAWRIIADTQEVTDETYELLASPS